MTISNAFTYRMPSGIPGIITRTELAKVDTQLIDSDTPPTEFGIPIKFVSGKMQPIASGDTVANVVKGFIAKPFPVSPHSASEAIGTATPDASYPGNRLTSGYMTVKCNASLPAAVPAKGGVVYCRKTDHGAGEYLIGGIESDADGGKCEAVPGCYFTGPADSSGNVEIEYNL